MSIEMDFKNLDKTRNIEDKEKAGMVEGINVADRRDIVRASFYYYVLIKYKNSGTLLCNDDFVYYFYTLS